GHTVPGRGNSDTAGAWSRYAASATGLLAARTCGAAFDTTLAVYTTCGGAAIACNDNGCGVASRVQWNATSGQNYLIRVAGNNAATGQFTLFIDTAPVSHSDVTIPLHYHSN